MHNNDFGLWVKGNTSGEAYANYRIIRLFTDGTVVTQTYAHTSLCTGRAPGDNTRTHTELGIKVLFPQVVRQPTISNLHDQKAPPNTFCRAVHQLLI